MAFFVDDKKVGGVKELCEALKLDIKTVPFRKRTKEFQMTMERDLNGNPKRDRDGNYIVKRNITGSPAFTIDVPNLGYEVRVRLANTQRKDKDNQFTYSPTIMAMMPGEDGVTPYNDELEFAFWYLHPWNLHSPFRKHGMTAFYEYKDNDAASKKENDWEEQKIIALSFILGPSAKSVRELRAVLKGLGEAGVDDLTDEVVKKKLRDKANADPIGFVNQLESREVVFAGMIQDAIDKKILTVRSLNGMQRWYLEEKEILPIPYGMDAIAVLREELSTKWHLYGSDIRYALEGKTISSNLNSPENDEFFKEIEVKQPEQKAEWTDEQRTVLRKMAEESWYDEKIKRLAAIDIDDEKLHHGTRKSYEAHKAEVEAYKATLAPVEEPA